MSTTTAPYVPGSATSEAAAKRIEEHLPRQREQVLKVYRLYGPITDNEAIDISALNSNSVRARRRELEVDGLVVRTGVTRNGSDLWRVTTTSEREELLRRKTQQMEEERKAKLDRVGELEELLIRWVNTAACWCADAQGECLRCRSDAALKRGGE